MYSLLLTAVLLLHRASGTPCGYHQELEPSQLPTSQDCYLGHLLNVVQKLMCLNGLTTTVGPETTTEVLGDAPTDCTDTAAECVDVTTDCKDATAECGDVTTVCADATAGCSDVTTEAVDAVLGLQVTTEGTKEVCGLGKIMYPVVKMECMDWEEFKQFFEKMMKAQKGC